MNAAGRYKRVFMLGFSGQSFEEMGRTNRGVWYQKNRTIQEEICGSDVSIRVFRRLSRLWAPGREGGEEGTDIEEVEGAVIGKICDGVLVTECGEECGDVEEVEGVIIV